MLRLGNLKKGRRSSIISIVAYEGFSLGEPSWDEAPFDTLREAEVSAKKHSFKYPKSLFTVEEDGTVKAYFWKGKERSEHEIRVRIRENQWG